MISVPPQFNHKSIISVLQVLNSTIFYNLKKSPRTFDLFLSGVCLQTWKNECWHLRIAPKMVVVSVLFLATLTPGKCVCYPPAA